MARVGCFCLMFLMMLSMMDCRANVVFEFGLNAYCVGEMMLFLVRCSMSCLLMRVSRSFTMMGGGRSVCSCSGGYVFLFEELDDFRELERVWIVVFADGFVQ